MDQRRNSNTSQKECIQYLPYYHANFTSTDEVANYIKKKAKGQPGSYLLRPSSRNKNLLTVSVLCKDKTVRHLHIQMEETRNVLRFFLVPDKKFDVLEDLIHYYSCNPVKNLEGVDNVFFKYPLCHDRVPNGLNRSPSQASSMSGNELSRGGSFASASSLPNGNSQRPPLPDRTRQPSLSASQDGSFSGSDSLCSFPVMPTDRPPLPLPPEMPRPDNLYYSHPRDVSEDISQKLVQQLQMSERCECGIPRRLAELPLGWTVHLSKDTQTSGKLFFQSNDGVTSWTIPEEVQMQLTKVHKGNLSKISPTWQTTIAKKGH